MLKSFYIFLTVLFLFGLGYFTFNLASYNENTTKLIPSLCAFEHQVCTQETLFGSAELTALPKRILSEQEIEFQLTLGSIELKDIKSAWIEGRDMYMGKVPLFFKPNNTHFIAKTMLGACTDPQMVWTMFVNIKQGEKTQTLMFNFVSYQN
ncbi:hypothetical protein [Thalassotalea aquiviva]|uniref:hypothetical protein n=1 Tax=Thalassotalea aquiviva TaxID=3242415 RepID=UPI00352B0660